MIYRLNGATHVHVMYMYSTDALKMPHMEEAGSMDSDNDGKPVGSLIKGTNVSQSIAT